jgi:hypothetical protein
MVAHAMIAHAVGSLTGYGDLVVTLTMPITSVLNTLESGLTTGIAYWAALGEGGLPYQRSDTGELVGRADWRELEVVDLYDHNRLVKLTRDSIFHGVAVMAASHPRHFHAMITRSGDRVTGDVLVQCCLFGRVVYG